MIDKKDIEKTAFLARLAVDADEIEAYQKQLSSAIGYFEKISKVQTQDVKPLVSPIEMKRKLRNDQAKKWDGVEAALENAPEKVGKLFKVPPVV